MSLRPEPFGALAYHFGTRRLTFLKRRSWSPSCGPRGQPDVRAAPSRRRRPRAERPAYLDALSGLAATGMLARKDAA